MKITIEGNEKKIAQLRKELKLRLKNDKLVLKVEDEDELTPSPKLKKKKLL